MHDLSSSCILRDYNRTFLQKTCAKILEQGPMPKHVAIIMDGNRRYAKSNNMASPTDGHKRGEEKILEVVNMMLDLHIREMTLFSFSKDNFKRSRAEVKGIMDLTTERMQKICNQSYELVERGLCWDVVGNWQKIPSLELKNLFAKTCRLTRYHQDLTIHLAFSYSSHTEMSEGVNNLTEGLLNESISTNDLNEILFQGAFTLHPTNPVDILIRTGGDDRLSDFVLWQASNAHLEFIECTWPEFGNWDLLKAIWNFQGQVVLEGLTKQVCDENDSAVHQVRPDNKVSFIGNIRRNRWNWIENLVQNTTKLRKQRIFA